MSIKPTIKNHSIQDLMQRGHQDYACYVSNAISFEVRFFEDQQRLEDALDFLEQGFTSGDYNERLFFKAARLSYQLGNYQKAYDYCLRALEQNNRHSYSLQLLGDIYLRHRQDPESAAYCYELAFAIEYQQWRKKDPTAPHEMRPEILATKLYNLFYEKKEYKKCLFYADKITTLKPDDHIGYSQKFTSLIKLERFPEALDAANKAVHLNSFDPLVFAMQSTALLKLGRLNEALDAVEKAVKLNPSDPISRGQRSAVLMALARYNNDAERQSTDGCQSRRFQPEDPEFW